MTGTRGFSVEKTSGYLLVRCPERMGAAEAVELSSLYQDWLGDPELLYVFDFTGVNQIDPVCYRPFVQFHRELKKIGNFMSSVNLPLRIKEQVIQAGLETVFSPKNSLGDAAKVGKTMTASPKRPTLDVKFVNPFVKAAQTTLEIQANTKVTAGKPRIKTDDEPYEVDIAGVISLASRLFCGSIALCFPEEVFLKIYASMMGAAVEPEITQEIEDAAGEILNIIFGQAKAELNGIENAEIQRAIPTVVRGGTLKLHHMSQGITILLPFETSAGPFHMEIGLEQV